MTFQRDIKRGIDAIFNPGRSTKKGMEITRALRFYYEFSILPFIAFVIIGFIVLHESVAFLNSTPLFSLFNFAMVNNPAFSFVAIILSAIGIFWILTPIGFFINAAIYQVVGKVFLHVWKGNYSKTFSAVMFGSLPVILFYWITPIPIAGILALMIFSIWDIVVFVIALSNLQKTSRLAAIGTFFVSVGIVSIIVFIIILLFSGMGIMALHNSLGSYNNTMMPGIH